MQYTQIPRTYCGGLPLPPKSPSGPCLDQFSCRYRWPFLPRSRWTEYAPSTCRCSPVASLQAIFSNTPPDPRADSWKVGAVNDITFAFRCGLCNLYIPWRLSPNTTTSNHQYISIYRHAYGYRCRYLGDDKQLVSSHFSGRYPFVQNFSYDVFVPVSRGRVDVPVSTLQSFVQGRFQNIV